MNKKFAFSLVFNLLVVCVIAQNLNIGEIPTRNYEKKEYKAGTQNWDVEQDSNGVVYIANNLGLLRFDGTYWNLYPISNKTIVRSIHISQDGKIYVGGQGEFGYFQASKNGELVYHSLSYLVPEKLKGFTDIWQIEETEFGIFFKSGEAIFKLFGDKLEEYTFEGNIIFMGKIGDQIFAQVNDKYIFYFNNGHFKLHQEIKNLTSPITSVLELPDGFFFTTLSQGILKIESNNWVRHQTKYDLLFKESFPLYTACALANRKVAIGSPPNGLLIFDSEWNLEYKADKSKGLQNNGVLSVKSDFKGNLWLGLDNGIDYLEANSAIRIIYPDGEYEGTGYAAAIHQNNLYLGTNNGLYKKSLDRPDDPLNPSGFEKIKGTDAQVWGLNSIDNQLFLGHHSGAFKINENQAIPLNNGIGTWLFKPINEDQIIAGQYNGLSLIEKKNGNWTFTQKLSGLEESSRILTYDQKGFFWMAHPYRGIFKVTPQPESGQAIFQFFDSEKGLPSNQFNHVFSINNKPIFTGEYGVFEFDYENDRFERYAPLADFFNENVRIKTLIEDQYGNIWFAADEEVGVLKINESGLERNIEKITFHELSNKLVGGFEYVYPYDERHVFFACEKGFILLNPTKYLKNDTSVNVLLSEINAISNDSLIFSGINQTPNNLITLDKKNNSLFFKFSAPTFEEEKQVTYQTKLDGLDNDWLSWSEKTEREINNLSPGDYVFNVRAKNGFGTISQAKSIAFRISPPWYASSTAKALYGITLVSALVSILFFQKSRYDSQKAILESEHQKKEAKHQQVVQETEAKINRLETEKLESQIKHNQKELALATMHLVQKNEMIVRIQKQLDKIIYNSELNSSTKSELKKLINILKQDQILDDDWNQFEIHFDQVHSNFLQKLREQFPQLSPNDYRLCAYLRMNLSTKEIAPLLNISVRGVEASRYRLRKKLNLSNQVNLTEFIMRI